MQQTANGVRIFIDDNDDLRLVGVTIGDVDANDFLFL